MAAVDTPYEDRLRWNAESSVPRVATAVHGTYTITGTGPYDVFYRSSRTQETEKLGTAITDAYHFCVDHNKTTLRITSPAEASTLGRNEKTCQVCGSIHAGEC